MIADPARSRMLAYLMAGDLASAGELSRAASIAPPTASGHLAKLVDAGFIVCEPRGRHRYFRLADGEIAQALQALALVAERDTHDRARASPERQRLRQARCCYGHLAGRVGVALFDCLRQDGRLCETAAGFELTERGVAWLAGLGFAAVPARAAVNPRRFAYGCLDWSERSDHLAGSLAKALLEHFIAQGWLRRRDARGDAGGHRVLTPTPTGRRHLLATLGIE